ncbi:hypothetical protein ACG33_09365 [Steroidobacter denitrificans]|uniref:DNA repair protein RecO n=1 Tax=Steroidobacter denitrificans TaxID=465721 RepID=A0A127FCK3_STEDE|nr:DNA repair protein RecO [Steroidobacter denitrificans]AMN47298.1 hypothetical protein ACG33_09365 [Steroidobacter denitrificans]
MPDARRVQLQPAYVLHHRPYRDTSRILELFTRDFGRVSVFARGARSARKSGAALISTLQPFNRLLLSWMGQGEAGRLTDAEFDGAVSGLPPQHLVSGFYLNELLMKLFARHDGHAEVFAFYDETIAALKSGSEALRPLRLFEKRLLDALGYGLALDRDAVSGEPLEPQAMYHYRIEQGAVRASECGADEGHDEHLAQNDGPAGTMLYSGAMLMSLAREDLHEADCAAARRLLRMALDRCLEGRELKSRQVMMALRRGN